MITQIKTIVFGGLCFFFMSIGGATACELPAEGLVYDAADVAAKKIELNINQIWAEEDVRAVKKKVDSCRKDIKNKLAVRQKRILSLLADKADIKRIQAVFESPAQLQKLEKEREEIIKRFLKESKDITYSGLMAVVVHGSLNKATRLRAAAEKMIFDASVKEIRDMALGLTSEAEEDKKILAPYLNDSYGEMEIERLVLQRRVFFNKRAQLVYLVLIKIRPFKEAAGQSGQKIEPGLKGYVADFMSEEAMEDFQAALAEHTSPSFAQKTATAMQASSEDVKKIVKQRNTMSRNETLDLSMRLHDRLRKKDKIIGNISKELNDARSNLADYYQKLGVACGSPAESCIGDALRKTDYLVDAEIQKGLAEKKKELALWEKGVSGSGEIAGELRLLAAQGYESIRNKYAGPQKLLSIDASDKVGAVQDKETEKHVYVDYEPDKIFIIPYTTSEGRLHLLEVVSFKITGAKKTPEQIAKDRAPIMMSGIPSKFGYTKTKAPVQETPAAAIKISKTDKSKPEGTISGIAKKYQLGNVVTLTIKARDDAALKSVRFYVENTGISKSWNVKGISKTLKYSFSTRDLKPDEYVYSLFLEDANGNSNSMTGLGKFSLFAVEKDDIKTRLQKKLLMKQTEKKRQKEEKKTEDRKPEVPKDKKDKIKSILKD